MRLSTFCGLHRDVRNSIYYVWGGGRRKIYLVESTMFSKGGGRLEKWSYLADKCRALRNNNKLGPFLTKTPRCLGFLVFHILCYFLCQAACGVQGTVALLELAGNQGRRQPPQADDDKNNTTTALKLS